LVGWCATVESCRIRPTFHNNGRLSFYTGTGARTKETTRALMMSPLNNLEQKGGWALAFKTSEFFWFRWTSPRLVYIF
jgi:L-amino acid N-acyltransferase YncA